MSHFLQDIYDFQRILLPDGDGWRVSMRTEVPLPPDGKTPYSPFFFAELDSGLHGVRPSKEGAHLFFPGGDVVLDPRRDSLVVARDGKAVTATLTRRTDSVDTVIGTFTYTAGPAEYDPYEDAERGLFDWLAERLRAPDFDAVFRAG